MALATAAPDPEKRVALVIGNGAYTSAQPLDNPVSDAKAMAAALQRLGFKVHAGYDLTAQQIRTTLAEFSASLPDARAALVYYAGHGVSVEEENYLLPVDIKLKSLTDLDLNAINISLILKQMKREERVNVVILDACRNNPFMEALSGTKGRSLVAERGLSRIENELAKGSLIAFATDPKAVALDGAPGGNSPFTRALLQHIEDPGVPIDTVMSRVRAQVWTETKNKQMPWVNTSIIGEFYLNPTRADAQAAAGQGQPVAVASLGTPTTVTVAGERQAQENRLWDSAEKANTPEDYRAYLETYPQGAYATMARNRIVRLTSPTGAPAALPPAVAAAGAAAIAVPPAVATAGAAPAAASSAAPEKIVYAPIVLSDEAKAEVGTRETEAALKLDAKARREVQQRLAAVGAYKGPVNGKFDDRTHKAIADWQKQHEAHATSWLGPLQHAALKQDSEPMYQQALTVAAAAAAAKAQRVASRRLTVSGPAPRVAQQRRAGGGRAPRGGGGDSGFGNVLGGIAAGVAAGVISGVLSRH